MEENKEGEVFQTKQKKVGKSSFQKFGFGYELYKALVYKGFKKNTLPIQKKPSQ